MQPDFKAMNKKISGSIHFFLILAVISMGLPQFVVEDLNRDRKIDLADAIIGAKNFAHTADQPSAFAVNVKNAVSAIQLVAGLETKITADDGKSISQNLDQNFLVPEKTALADSSIYSELNETTTNYCSIHHLPQIPPPRLSMKI
jgi:hypothetical protein